MTHSSCRSGGNSKTPSTGRNAIRRNGTNEPESRRSMQPTSPAGAAADGSLPGSESAEPLAHRLAAMLLPAIESLVQQALDDELGNGARPLGGTYPCAEERALVQLVDGDGSQADIALLPIPIQDTRLL